MQQTQCPNGHTAQTTLPTNSHYWKARAEELESQLNMTRRLLVKLAAVLPIEYLHYLGPLSLESEAAAASNDETRSAAG
jgi:hypothetical protein